MVFSSIEFIYYFLPLVLLIYFVVPKKYKNLCLLVFSLLFYSFGEPIYILLMLFSSVVDYVNGLLVEKNRGNKWSKVFLIVSIVINVGLLAVFKYLGFIVESMNDLFNLSIQSVELALPIGISFYTFQTMSYTIDVYRGEVKAQKNFISFACYVSLFPQLIAGPIVRYKDIAKQIDTRVESKKLFSEGVERFIYGLGKKVLIANNIGLIAEQALAANQTVGLTWIYAIAFGLQIYFDFSGYSDMAIGLGRMFGFEFKENFNYPYISKSITEFWRRWHMSLGGWFRDYLYVPLGGNRVGLGRLILNIMIVWMITGLWHGAAFNFVIWGLYFGVLLLIEKLFLQKYLSRVGFLSHIYVIVIVLISWVIFTSTDISMFTSLIQGLFGKGVSLSSDYTLFLFKDSLVVFGIAIILSTPIFRKVKQYKWYKKITPVVLLLILVASTAFIVDSSFNPFLYFRF